MADYSKMTYEAVKRLESKSLTNTKPFGIASNTLYTDLNGYAIQAITDCTFDTGTVFGTSGEDLTGETLLAGHVWYIPILNLKLASGSCWVYRHDN